MLHPFDPDVNWTLAVSRRFQQDDTGRLYADVIEPVLRRHGLVLECSYASDAASSLDYWVNRINAILEVSDIHVLIDLERSAFTAYELERSRLLARRGGAPTLGLNFSWGESGVQLVLRPVRLFLVDEKGRDTFSRRKRLTVLRLKGLDAEAIAQRLESHLAFLKGRRAAYVRRLQRTIAMLPRQLRDASPDVITVAADAYSVAKAIASGNTFPELREVGELRVADAPTVSADQHQVVRDMQAWHISTKTGEVALPGGLRDRYRFLRDHYIALGNRAMGATDVQRSRFWRSMIAIISFAGAVGYRKRRRRFY